MKKNFFSCFILILMLFSIVNTSAASTSFECSFEDANDIDLWSGAILDESAAYSGDYGIVVQNPLGEVRDGKITNVLEYSSYVHLEAGKVYALSGYAMNPDSTLSSSARCNASMLEGSKNIIAYVSGINGDWAKFSATFYSGESGDFNLSLYFENTSDVLGVFVDDITLQEVECTVSSVGLYGDEEILIPSSGSVKVNYSPYLLSNSGEKVFLLYKNMIHATVGDFDGVSFDSSTLSLTISDNAIPNTVVEIHYALKNGENTAPSTLRVTLTNNLIANSSLENSSADNYWIGNFYQETQDDNTYICAITDNYSEIGYFAQIKYTNHVLLVENTMYVLHARVRSTSRYSDVNYENGAFEYESSVYFAVNNASGNEWHDIFVPFFPERSGIYNIDLLLYSQDDCTFYIDDIRLCAETPSPSQITIHAPGNIPVPDEITSYPANAYIRDQLGNILEFEECSISLFNENDSIFYDSENQAITVFPDAEVGEYTLCAVYEGERTITSQMNITVSRDYIGDGGFEHKTANEWWMASSPYGCTFEIVGENKHAQIQCDGEYFALFNNSYIHLMENGAYVFRGNFSASTDATITAFLDCLDGEAIPLIQFSVPAGTTLDTSITPEIFRADVNTVGRLMFYCSSDNGEGFTLSADNLYLKKALISVASPTVSGSLYVNGAAHAEFGFYNSITEDNDISACVVNWYVSDKPNSDFVQLSESGFYIYFDTTFADKYVYFDVTPVCPVTGFSGDTLSCIPFKVAYDQSEGDDIPPPPPQEEIFIPPTEDITPPSVMIEFDDINGHWAQEGISYLAKKGIVNGKSDSVFEPEASLTRGEAAKILCLAFSIEMAPLENVFTDVSSDAWFAPYINALYAKNLIKGTSADKFSPNKPITREELAVLIIRIYEKQNGTILFYDNYLFNDSYAISDWAEQAVNKAVSLKIIQGDDKSCFLPLKSTTRAEACTLIYRLLKK